MDTPHNKPAEERLQEAFLQQLRKPGSLTERIAVRRIHEILDGHFRTFCSFYSYEDSLKLQERLAGSVVPFLLPTNMNRISVSSLAKDAGVNRTTFYKCYPNIGALYNACCEELTEGFLSIPVPEEKTEQTMYGYGVRLFRRLRDEEDTILLLSHKVERRSMTYQIAHRLRDRIAATLSSQERSSFDVQKNLELFPELFSTWAGMLQIEKIAPELYPDHGLPAYDPDRSLIGNLASFYAVRYGGQEELYYLLGLAALKLLAKKSYMETNVSELCQTAGYPRSAFYAHFRDITDYIMKICENSVLVCVSAFLFFLQNPGKLTKEAMEIFRGEMVPFKTEGVRMIFVNGAISYLFPMIFTYLKRILLRQARILQADADAGLLQAELSYYIGNAMRLFSMYYLGDVTDAELTVRKAELERVKLKLGL